jgi:hypothetical protein
VKARQATSESASATAQQLESTAHENPVPFIAAGAFQAGVAIGWLLGR